MTDAITAKFVSSAASIVVRTAPDGGLQQTNSAVTLKNIIATDLSRRLDTLVDVVPDSDQTPAGSTLVYDPITDTYVVKLLDLDGGSF
jgi:hypothetical protein